MRGLSDAESQGRDPHLSKMAKNSKQNTRTTKGNGRQVYQEQDSIHQGWGGGQIGQSGPHWTVKRGQIGPTGRQLMVTTLHVGAVSSHCQISL